MIVLVPVVSKVNVPLGLSDAPSPSKSHLYVAPPKETVTAYSNFRKSAHVFPGVSVTFKVPVLSTVDVAVGCVVGAVVVLVVMVGVAVGAVVVVPVGVGVVSVGVGVVSVGVGVVSVGVGVVSVDVTVELSSAHTGLTTAASKNISNNPVKISIFDFFTDFTAVSAVLHDDTPNAESSVRDGEL